MATSECPSCGLDYEGTPSECPYCGYEFPVRPAGRAASAWLMILLMLGGVLGGLWWLFG